MSQVNEVPIISLLAAGSRIVYVYRQLCVRALVCVSVPLHFRRLQFALRLAFAAKVSGSPLKVLVLVLGFNLCYLVYGRRTNCGQSVNGLFS
jgi:hypothetical protein